MPPSPPPPLRTAAGNGAAASVGSRAGTPAGSLAELRDAQEGTADALQLVAEEVERQGGVQAQMVGRVTAVEIVVDALAAVSEQRIARLEGKQAAADRQLAATDQRLAAVEQQLAGTASSAAAPRLPAEQPALRIGDHCFQSADAAWVLIRQLKRDLLDKPVRWDDQEQSANFRFLLGLLGRHPRGAAKVLHPPVTGFVSRVNAFGTGIEFHFIDACGSEHDFSALKCMEQRQEPPAAKLAGAMSAAVRQNKAAFRRSCRQQWCQLCGAGSRAQLVVEHDRPTLPQLRARFLEACRRNRLPVPTEFAAEPGSNATVFRAQDGEFAELWRQYHAQHARLRLLCKTCLWAENERRGIPQCKGRLLLPAH